MRKLRKAATRLRLVPTIINRRLRSARVRCVRNRVRRVRPFSSIHRRSAINSTYFSFVFLLPFFSLALYLSVLYKKILVFTPRHFKAAARIQYILCRIEDHRLDNPPACEYNILSRFTIYMSPCAAQTRVARARAQGNSLRN